MAVDRFCQQARRCCFTGTTRPTEQVSMADTPSLERISQGARDMFLSYKVFKRCGTPRQIQSLFGQKITPQKSELRTEG
jgi:hypothetical protein